MTARTAAHEEQCREDDARTFGVGYFKTPTEATSSELVNLLRQRQFPEHLIRHAVELAWRFEESIDLRERVEMFFDFAFRTKVDSQAKARADMDKYWAERDEWERGLSNQT